MIDSQSAALEIRNLRLSESCKIDVALAEQCNVNTGPQGPQPALELTPSTLPVEVLWPYLS